MAKHESKINKKSGTEIFPGQIISGARPVVSDESDYCKDDFAEMIIARMTLELCGFGNKVPLWMFGFLY